MRWKINKDNYESGETRIVEGFLFFPLIIEGEKRWLEHAKWEEYVCTIYKVGSSGKIKYNWAVKRWID